MLIRLFFLATALSTACACGATPRTPTGWRAPTPFELSAPGEAWRTTNPNAFQLAQGDFNGDGSADEAVLLVSKGGKDFAMFFHSSAGKWTQLARKPIDALRIMGVSTLAPGTYATACGKGYWQCKQGEPKELTLTNEAILFFVSESASSVFFWSKMNKKFEQVWLID